MTVSLICVNLQRESQTVVTPIYSLSLISVHQLFSGAKLIFSSHLWPNYFSDLYLQQKVFFRFHIFKQRLVVGLKTTVSCPIWETVKAARGNKDLMLVESSWDNKHCLCFGQVSVRSAILLLTGEVYSHSSSASAAPGLRCDGQPGQPSEKLWLPAQVPPGGRQRCGQRGDPGQPAGWIGRVPVRLQ